jgi:hypothetical protein
MLGQQMQEVLRESSRLMFGFLEVVQGATQPGATSFGCGLSQTGISAQPHNIRDLEISTFQLM